MDKLSERRLVENETIFRQVNTSVAEFVEETSSPREPVRFYCECSNAACRERIELTPERYKQLHKNSLQFIALAGHETPEIERVVKEEKGFNVIEKFRTLPTQEELNEAIKIIKT